MSHVSPVDATAFGLEEADGAPVSLFSRFTQGLAEGYVWAGHERDAILVAGNDPEVASDPARVHGLQLQVDAYTKKIAVIAALMSHATKGIETVVKS